MKNNQSAKVSACMAALIALLASVYSASSFAAREQNLDLTITSQPPAVVNVSATADYTFLVQNLGNRNARSTKLKIDLSPTEVIAAGTDSRCKQKTNGKVVCKLGKVRKGASTSVNVSFEVPAENSYSMSAAVSSRDSDSDPNNNEVQGSYDSEIATTAQYQWTTPNNVLLSIDTDNANSTGSTGWSYGTLYPPNAQGEGQGVLDGVFATYVLDTNGQTMTLTRGVGQAAFSVTAPAVDAVSYQKVELNPTPSILQVVSTICLFEQNIQAYSHPYNDIFPVQSVTSANIGIAPIAGWSLGAPTVKAASFNPNGTVDIDGTQYFYTANRDNLVITDSNSTVVFDAVRAWNNLYIDASPAAIDVQTGNGTYVQIQF